MHTVSGKAARGVWIASAIALGLVLFYIWGLSALYGRPSGWVVDATGLPRTNEFMGIRAAGDLALNGRPVDAYNWVRHETAMAEIAGRTGMPYFPFPYPPIFLLLMAALATLPYLVSVAVWLGATSALYAWTIARLTGVRQAALWALASPAAAINAFVTHTGFATAAVFGLALEAIPRRPILAGMLIALLAVKPQLGLLIPFALMAGGYWRVVWSAAATVIALVLVSLACFGLEPWLALPGQMATIQDAARFGHPRIGETNYTVLVSVYGALRAVGAPDVLAMAAQAVAGLGMAAGVLILWRSAAPYALKAAGLASASLLATPYLFIYDLVHLSVAVAFLVRHTGLAGLARSEISVIAGAGVMIFMPIILPLPLGFAANAFIASIIFMRVWPYLVPACDAPRADPSLAR
jgi:arabinofuranan 3-O-arabinosyltransferase